ncbi:MAG: nucleotidyltransferase domain-containing protein [Candidatus Woesearchaeota archaeon]
MEFSVQKRDLGDEHKQRSHSKEELALAYKFTSAIYKEFGEFVRAVVLFGSAARQQQTDKSDIDILIIVDDVSIILSAEVAEAYRIIIEKAVVEISPKLHVTTLKLSSFWQYIRAGDPIGVNILREGLPLMDTGFIRPLQLLLKQGRIRPSAESIWNYFTRAPDTLHNSKWHLLQASMDLYWAVIDAAHAALMKLDEVPPSPEHVADLIEERMVKPKLVDKKYAQIMSNFYKLSKMIIYREIKEISGSEYDRYYKDAYDFVSEMKKFIEKPKA